MICIDCKQEKTPNNFFQDGRYNRPLRCCRPCYMQRQRNYKNRISSKPKQECEVCCRMTSAEGAICEKCSRDAVKEFGALIDQNDADGPRMPTQIQMAQDAYDNATTWQARLRWRKVLESGRENTNPNATDLNGKHTLALGAEIQAQCGTESARPVGNLVQLQHNQERTAV